MIKRLILFFAFVSLGVSLSAQGDADITQRWFNETLYNPAATGNSYTSSLFLHARQQWVGIKGAPSTQAFSADSYIENWKSGIGISVMHDEIGRITSSFNVRASYSYHFQLTQMSFISLGISGGILSRNRDINRALVDNSYDPDLAYGNASEISPDFDFGVEYRGSIKIGLAVKHLGVNKKEKYFANTENIWAYASSRLNTGTIMSVEPSVAFTYRNKSSRVEVGALFYFLKMEQRYEYNDRFWLGGMFRFNKEFALLAGVNITKSLRMGYSFDYGYGFNSLSRYGTHEIFLAWQLNRLFYKEPLCPAYKSYDRRK
ncbi:MAG: PorP/SprF family type IX secretion system membrane protein [Prevotellaceae bacterium]|jgi:type IX secretion system PorP/SprF family membrane protein|nr:PorP/SprF family type IX secretion system membrane protein [Prevotellaceae bacterium]